MSAERILAFEPQKPTQRRPEMTAGDIVRRRLEFLEVRRNAGKCGAKHLEESRSVLLNFASHFGDRIASELIQHDLTEWLCKNPDWAAPDTRHNAVGKVISCFRWADDEGLFRPCPYKRTESLKEERRSRRDATNEEAEVIWRNASAALREVLWLIGRGVRECEAISLKWENVLFLESAVVLSAHKNVRKTRKAKIVGLDPEDRDELFQRFAARKPGQTLVCITATGRAWTKNNVCKVFRELREKLGLPSDLVPNSFRHRFVTQARLKGADPEAVARQAGHSRQMSERQYMHLGASAEFMSREAQRSAQEAREMKRLTGAATPPATPPQPTLFDDL